MKRLPMMLLVALILVSIATAALADREVVVTPLTGSAVPLNVAPNSVTADCDMGNLNPIAYAITDWIWGGESYRYAFYADPSQCSCAGGFTVDTVHMLMRFGAEDVPVTFGAVVGFEEASFDETAGCSVLGPEACASPAYNVTIDTEGLYDVALPMGAGNCPCAYFGYWYSVSFTFTTVFDSSPDLITDASPVGCVSWNDYGLGWLDLQDFGLPGEVSMYASVSCCENPVQDELQTFDGVKALFR